MQNRVCWNWIGLTSTVILSGTIALVTDVVNAQVIPDGTLGTENSEVRRATVRGREANLIEGGATRGRNLFHSFREFGVREGDAAYFANPVNIENIFGRVTGNNPSNILGTLGVDGTANLFLMNPNGILFGPNARLDVGGSFAATTANAIGFGELGFFSATNPEVPSQLLTVNPSAFLFNQLLPGTIENQSTAGLRVPYDQSLMLLGGDVSLAGGRLYAPGGRIELAAVTSNSFVNLDLSNEDLRLNYENVPSFRDIQLSNVAVVDVSGERAGDIQIQSKNQFLSGSSFIIAHTQGVGDGGSITLYATDSIIIDGANIEAQVLEDASGDGGNITIETRNLALRGSLFFPIGLIDTVTYGEGNAGSIIINAEQLIATNEGIISSVTTSKDSTAGNAGDVTVETNGLRLTESGRIESSTFGAGNAGDVTIRSTDFVEVTGISANGFNSRIASQMREGASGNGGDLLIETNRLIIGEDAQVQSSLFGSGQGGSLNINAKQSIDIIDTNNNEDPTGIFVGPEGEQATGNAGDSAIRTGRLNIQGGGSEISNAVDPDATGNAGNTLIDVDRLIVGDGGQIRVETLGTGQGGNLTIIAHDSVDLFGTSFTENDNEDPAGLFLLTLGFANAGSLSLTTERLRIRDGATITASTGGSREGTGRGGNLTINASEAIEIIGTSPSGNLSTSIVSEAGRIFDIEVFSRLGVTPTAAGGDITIITRQLTIQNGADLSTSTYGSGAAGDITLNATGLNLGNGARILAQGTGTGDAGNIQLDVKRLQIQDDAAISAASIRRLNDRPTVRGRPGSISIRNADSVTLTTNSEISTVIEPRVLVDSSFPQSGNINIQTRSLTLNNNSQITASTSGQGNAGNIRVRDAESITLNNNSAISTAVNTGAIGQGGNINLNTNRLALDNRSTITSSTAGTGNTGRITITASDRTTLRDNSRITSEVQAGATGDSQQIAITTDNLSLRGESEVSVATNGNGSAGDIVIRSDVLSLGNSTISSEVQRNAIVPRSNGNRSSRTSNVSRDNAIVSADNANRTRNTNDRQGNIDIATRSLRLNNGARISASTRGQGRAGNIAINNAQTVTLDDNSILSTEVGRSATGRGGNITLDATVLSLDDGQIRANTAGRGNAGAITIRNADTVSVDGGSISTAVGRRSSGRGGAIELDTNNLNLSSGATISSASRGQNRAGNISITAEGTLRSENGDITTSARQAAGGAIEIRGGDIELLQGSSVRTNVSNGSEDGGNITVRADAVRLQDNSDIQTNVAGGTGAGGDIQITADSVLAFDDSDIISEAPNQGGDIRLNTPVFFGENYQPDASTEDNSDGNNRVDLNATGSVSSGAVQTPNTDFIQNSLSDLPTNAIDSDQLLANSCIARTETGGTFLITGSGSLPAAPGNDAASTYPTGEVRSIPDADNSNQSWQLGEPIVEPQGVYRLPDGRLIMSRECAQ